VKRSTFKGNEGSSEGDDYGGRVKLGVLDATVRPMPGCSMHASRVQGSSRKAMCRSSTLVNVVTMKVSSGVEVAGTDDVGVT
jgi:hypothetical protein